MMGHHINDKGQFQSDKYPDLAPDHIIFSFKDKNARAVMKWYAALTDDKEFGEDIVTRIRSITKEL